MSQFIEFATNHWDLFLALVIILGMMLFQMFGSRLRGYTELDPFEAVKLINHDDALVIDVREEKEYNEGHVTDSRHIPLSKLKGKIEELESYKGKPILALCRSGSRSGVACGMLRKEQFEQVYNLKGGVMAWQNAGLPLSRDDNKEKKKKRKGKQA